MNALDYLTDSVEKQVFALLSFKGYVTENDICEIINNQLGTDLRGDEKKIYRAKEFGID